MVSALIVNAYSIERVAMPPDVGTWAPIRIELLAADIWRAYLRVGLLTLSKSNSDYRALLNLTANSWSYVIHLTRTFNANF